MAPTEYRVIAKRARAAAAPGLRGLVAAGEALDAGVLHAWHEAPGCGSATATGRRRRGSSPACRRGAGAAGLDGPGAAGGRASTVVEGELVLDPATDPTFFLRYLGEAAARRPVADGRPRPCRRGRLPVLRGPRRRRDHLRRLPDRAVRGRVGARGAPRGRGGGRGGGAGRRARGASSARSSSSTTASRRRDALVRELQDHVKRTTAPYKYPRIVDFADALPRTPSGKIRRAALRA